MMQIMAVFDDRLARAFGAGLARKLIEWIDAIPDEELRKQAGTQEQPIKHKIVQGAMLELAQHLGEHPAPHVPSAAVQSELNSVLAYVETVARSPSARASPSDDGAADTYGYVVGVVTTMLHLGLLTNDQHREWLERLSADLPPRGKMGI